MECIFEKETVIPLSLCDNCGRLSVHNVFTVFMDLAAEHAELIEVGADRLAQRGMFWLTVRTKVHINSRPLMMSRVQAETWPEAPGRIRCNRHYSLRDAEQVYAEGVTEWAVIDVNTGKLCKASDIYRADTVYSQRKAEVKPFEKISEDFESARYLGSHTVNSADIDLGQHMNNAAYVRAMMGFIPCRELEELDITDAEVVFRAPCYEGNELSVYRRDFDGGFDLGMLLPDGKAVCLARFTAK
ncbi:MAG: hypothetical protein IJE90_05095 [Clostridia bacterium]|nr:hypothetical protein [Clostridia bacterium]